MTTLSPAAQAVIDAAFPAYDDETLHVATGEQHAGKIAAAALRAAVEQCRVLRSGTHTKCVPIADLFAIATELENAS
jgi:hypothetical protein